MAACGGEEAVQEPEPGTQTSSAKDWGKDDRLEALMGECYERGPFNGDTSDMLPILIAKLQSSSLDVMRNIREELARAGEPAIRELDRLVRRSYSDAHASHNIVNALGVIQLSEAGGGDLAAKLLTDCLGHPQETIRNATIRALTQHARPEHYDDLIAVFRVTHDTTQADVITALHTADSKRLEADLEKWLIAGEMKGLAKQTAKLVAQVADAETAERFSELLTSTDDRVVRAFLVSTFDDGPNFDDASFGVLDEMLANEEPQIRSEALAALEFTGATERIVPVLLSDPFEALRLMACSLLGHRLDEPAARAALIEGLNDEAEKVRESCLKFLLEVGEERAVDDALSLLAGSRSQIGSAVRALAGSWEANPGLGERVLDLMIERFETRANPELSANQYLLQAIAQVPGPASTEWLLEQSERFREDRSMGRDPARWLIMQASNTGQAGVLHLRERWREETDLVRRFDLLWSASLEHDDSTREFLLEVLEADRSAPHERLYVAERLAREGPAQIVAPRIKRAKQRMTDETFRPAMECLLWRWYG